ncbi:transcriptional regulator, MucR family [Methylobacterium sp. 174MFSha1.1]|uniref:MucR family transcriptional regulator n=1 Tax=Methylobacterium sp. 174MFSha1.1 TaxID=1502749 RepID=UPI0008E4464E|nr:MucR family transcriptional regulator [Methylobacterium sp. 174MFSha1.1]SFV08190.1 transcriptional regulator, MucR family [Methylobacterium sp. 174MFSha1.1]
MDDVTQKHADIGGLASDIAGAYAMRNNIPVSRLPGLVAAAHAALMKFRPPSAPGDDRPMPAASLRRTITPDHIISLEDGRPYKSLKRHLTTRGLTPDEYRRKWGLPPDYPMVAPAYSAQRSRLAKSTGFGRIGFGRVRRNSALGQPPEAGVVRTERGGCGRRHLHEDEP